MALEPDSAMPLRFPRSAVIRGAITWAKVLRSVKHDRSGVWIFDGELVRPGTVVGPGLLRSETVVLECAGTNGAGWGHRGREVVYILWRLDGVAGEFRELARAVCENRDWTVDLGPIARRALAPPKPVLVDPERVCERICGVLDEELDPLHRDAQRILLLALYDRLAARVVELPGPPAPPARKPASPTAPEVVRKSSGIRIG